MVEEVYVVERAMLFPRGAPQGFWREELGETLAAIDRAGRFVPRPTAEEDPSLKQVIPYAVVTCRGRTLLLRRLARQSEKRLHDKLSIGVGGHINPVDPGAGSLVERGLRRELFEELSIDCPFAAEALGLVNDDSTPVGSVHLGVLYRIEVEDEARVRVREEELMEGRFVGPAEIGAALPRMESWSQIAAREVLEPLAAGTGWAGTG